MKQRPEAVELAPRMRELKRCSAQKLVEITGRPRRFVDRGLAALLSDGLIEIDSTTGEYVLIRNA